MPIEIQVWDDAAGVGFHCTGTLSAKDFADATESFLATPEAIKKWRYGIIDLTSVESLNVRYEEVDKLVGRTRHLAQFALSGVIVAVSSPSDLGFGLARMWETQTFRSRAEAEFWLKHRVPQKFGLDPSFGRSSS
jgi:hypothetical protein